MFGSKKKLNDKLNDLMEQLRPDLSRESLGVGPDFPGVAPNPLLMFDVETADGISYYVALARDADPAHVQQLSDEIASRKRT
ncbi:MAG TPA: hypothetical protein VLK58_11010 [Conexibacter sp.]|nr:hypothetical protein [Conexibacter sp.]